MQINGIYVPDSIAEAYASGQESGSVRLTTIKAAGEPTPPATAPAPNPVIPFLWFGAITSATGLTLEILKYRRDRKR